MPFNELVHPVTFHRKHFIEICMLPPLSNENKMYMVDVILITSKHYRVIRAMLEMAQ